MTTSEIALDLRLPANFLVTAPEKDLLALQATFDQSGFNVSLSFDIKEANEWDGGSKADHWNAQVTGIKLRFEAKKPGILEEDKLATPEGRDALLARLVPILNRVLTALRNYGRASHQKQVRVPAGKTDTYLKYWNTQLIVNGASKPLIPRGDLLSSLLDWPREPGALVQHHRFQDVEEALQNQIQAPPEQEFIINSVEALEQGLFRHAVLEGVIGLEIVVSQYLKLYLLDVKHLEKDVVTNFVSPKLGFSDRISVLLKLATEERHLKDIDLKKVRTVIGWRNGIVHEKGNLPEGLKEADLRAHLAQVYDLVEVLAVLTKNLSNASALSELAERVRIELKLAKVTISFLHLRMLQVGCTSLGGDLLSDEEIKHLAEASTLIIRTRINRLDAKHFLFHFMNESASDVPNALLFDDVITRVPKIHAA